MANIIVFGADGFIGKHLTRALAADERNSIIAFDRFADYANGEPHEFNSFTNITVKSGDFFNRNDVCSVLAGADYVFHLVSATNPASSINDPLIDIDLNLRASVDLFKACVDAGVKKVIFPSSGGTVYGDVSNPIISEDINAQPRSPYGIVKLAIEHYLRYFKSTFELDYVVYRIANPYGPGQNIYGKQGVIPIFMHKAISNEPIQIYGDGSMVRDYIYISDLIDMIVGSFVKENKYNEYNLGSGKGESIEEVVGAIEKCTGLNLQKDYQPAPASFVQKIVLDTKRFTDEFGIAPKISIEQGMEKTWEYVKGL